MQGYCAVIKKKRKKKCFVVWTAGAAASVSFPLCDITNKEDDLFSVDTWQSGRVGKDPLAPPDSWPVEDLSVSKGPFGWICFGGSSPPPRLPPPLISPGGSCTHCIGTDSRPAARGAPLWDGSRTVARSGRCTATLSVSQTTGARTRAICCPFHLHTHLKPCQQFPSWPALVAPSRKLILRHPTGTATRAPGFSWLDTWLVNLTWKNKTKQRALTFLSRVSRLQHSSQAHCCSFHLRLDFSGARLSHFH